MSEALQSWAVAHGFWGLALVAFLAATILPFSSEVAFTGAVLAGMPPWMALVSASVGNCLACLVNYGLGRMAREGLRERLERSWGGKRALAWTERYGVWALLGSWLPAVGDPITIVAGLARVSVWWFVAVVLPLRVARYVAILWAIPDQLP